MVALSWLVDQTPILGRPVLLAVDGVDASGKTTFAAALARTFGQQGRPAVVVHEDDFLNPRRIRHRRGRDSPEGFLHDSYDLRALSAKVLDPLRPEGSRRIVPRVFDHATDSPVAAEAIAVPPEGVVIVEGLFLHRDELLDRWDLSVFLDVPFTESARRMAGRDGTDPDPEHPSIRRYVDGQRHYLATCAPHERATYVIDNTGPAPLS